jgi:hypothetical protein
MNGIVQIIPIETFENEHFGISRGERFERLTEWLEDEGETPHDFGSWLSLSAGIKRGLMIVIEAKSPAQSLFLKFSAEAPDAGTYRVRTMPHGDIEEGRTAKVVAIPVDAKDPWAKPIASYEHRFVVTTVKNLRPHTRKIWIIGINDPGEALSE